MRIEVENLTEAWTPFAYKYRAGEVELDESTSLASEAAVEGQVSRKGEQVRLRGRIKAEVEVLCDRCLAATREPLEVEFEASYIPREAAAERGDNVELLADDLEFAAYEGDAVDVDELVREQILLALPTRLLCREDCRGLCQKCGADLNAGECSCEQGEIDPRWSALAGWNDKSRES
jgi:uncharacterized protein